MIDKPISRIVADYIAANVSGYTLGTNLFVGMMPDEPPSCVTVYDTAAGGTVYAQDGADAIAAGVQVAARGLGYEEVWNALGTVRDAIRTTGISGLQSYSGATGMYTIGPAIPQGSPIPLGWDERRRFSFNQSFRLFHQKTA